MGTTGHVPVKLRELLLVAISLATALLGYFIFYCPPQAGVGAPASAHLIRLGHTNTYEVEISDSSENVLPPGFTNHKYELDKGKHYNLCAIGAGLSGTVFAERAANHLGQTVLVIDSRPHIGGNCYDFIDQKTGILRNQYGSHLFHTKMERVWKYVNSNPNAPKWKRWYHAKFGYVKGTYVPIPVNIQTVNRLMDQDIQNEDEMKAYLRTVQIPCPPGGCQNAEQMAKSRVGEELYKLIFEGYTVKQWGRDPKELNASVTARIPVFSTFDPRYFADKWQALPADGYTAWFAAMLDHPLIDVVLSTDFFNHRAHLEKACDKIVYTGPIDSYFASEGMPKLEYRSIIFTEERYYNHPGYMLPTPVLNYPGLETNYTRAVEYKHYLHRPCKVPASNGPCNHTIVVKETSSSNGDPYYPVPTKRNQELFAKYQELATEMEKTGKIQFVGRLANYKYYNMDQAIDNALTLFYESINQKPPNDFEMPLHQSLPQWRTPTSSRRLNAADFMNHDFKAYKGTILSAMATEFPPSPWYSRGLRSKCQGFLWDGEFGMELRAMTPWAYRLRDQCGGKIHTKGVVGTKFLYYFSNYHEVIPTKRRDRSNAKIRRSPFSDKNGTFQVHVPEIPHLGRWKAPPMAKFFRRPELAKIVDEKPLVVILNKYSKEWGNNPVNFMSVETLRKVLDYLTPKYTVLYKRHTATNLTDHSGEEKDLAEKGMIRKRYSENDVLLFEDYTEHLTDPEDVNLLLFGFMSWSSRFLTVQGGTAVTGSYFGGTNVILCKMGQEPVRGDYKYFNRFSNASVIVTKNDGDFLDQVKKNM